MDGNMTWIDMHFNIAVGARININAYNDFTFFMRDERSIFSKLGDFSEL